jgi:transcription initiation factor TFIIIB Brf1 subunit/transcription initiation factor TFIIB
MTDDTKDLMPCPFCGGTDLYADLVCIGGRIECNYCGCVLQLPEKSPDTQVISWNTRSTPPPEVIEQVAKALEYYKSLHTEWDEDFDDPVPDEDGDHAYKALAALEPFRKGKI